MRRHGWVIASIAALMLGITRPVGAQQFTALEGARGSSVVNTPHNLSAGGPGNVRAAGEQQVCIFCHTPHHATATQPLWNRRSLPAGYTPYRSTSLDAQPGQPTGSSKLCLSCHDGTIALGDVVSRWQPIQMAGGMTTLPPGHANIGTNLADDHPVSFKYDSALTAKDPKLKDPGSLPAQVRLDAGQEVQCTSCHEPHDNSRGNFLVMDNTNSQLCNSCHEVADTTVASHQQCADCHKQHTAPSGPLLLRQATVTQTCTLCHSNNTSANDGQAFVQGQNVAGDLLKMSRHDTNPSVHVTPHAPANVNCSDCHGPHTMKAGAGTGATAAAIPANFGDVAGVNAQGAAVAKAQHEYEVCFKCHGDASPATPVVQRQVEQTNTRVEFANAVSMHPVTETGRNNDVPSLLPGHTTASQIKCSDCHGSDSGVRGVHGSSFDPLLLARYDTTSQLPESADAYALCYKCHDRNSILANETFAYHGLHVAGNPASTNRRYASCSACHDAHGIASGMGNATNNSHLINFDVKLVKPSASNGRLEFRDTGTRSGTCNLSCHGHDHVDATYDATTPRAALPGLPESGEATRRLMAPKSRTMRRGK